MDSEVVGRHKPASGVLIAGDQPTIVFVTVCTKDRVGWLVETGVKEGLVEAWAKADAWIVGNYLLMPDHMHFFLRAEVDGVSVGWVDELLEKIV